MSEVEEIEARLAKQLEEYRSIILGTDLCDYMGNRVVESRTTSGNLVAVKVNRKEDYRRSEAEMMQFAHEKGILTPRVRGCYDVKRGVIATVTDRVPGDSLDKVWHTLTKSQKKNIELQLKQQVQEMRKHTQPYIGRIGNVTTYNFFDRLHNNDMGPFASEEEFDEWCFARVKKKRPSKFVLTHGDLSARNIMVQDGQLTGIVDWAYSGFFPEYMEYALATVIHESIEDWWLPVLKRVLEPSGYLRAKFIATIKDRGW
ncbi:kinase-like protein [Aspergillus piperis CBS 112811]|uniref:Kinase-like protein n=1 Tax=Aspergillus piperis CBS 112811 TaxID=1448313 RepID=A0A8G1QYJ5_9EURO|nr:kinase-like protein [Aspergillus piperis CBS 112811]RAH54974.1 kinase-like protein [Aspergillus piperis CBS 112811]